MLKFGLKNNLKRFIENTVSVLPSIIYQQMESYSILSSLIQTRRALPRMRGPSIYPDFGVLLIDTLIETRPKIILELGGGTSTLLMAYAIEKFKINAHIHSIDHKKQYLDILVANLKKHELTQYVTPYHAPLRNHLYQDKTYSWYDHSVFSHIIKVDFLLIDGPPSNSISTGRFMSIPLLHEQLTNKATILIDDAKRKGEKANVRIWQDIAPGIKFDWRQTETGAFLGKKHAP